MTSPERSNSPTLRYAYDIEGHSIAINTAQAKNELAMGIIHFFGEIEEYVEAGLGWYVFGEKMVFYASDCNNKIIQGLIYKSKPQRLALYAIQTLVTRPDVLWGRNNLLVATLGLVGDESVLYKSPGFSLEKWLERRFGNGH